jgi:chromosome segregation ATPase
MTNLEKTLIKKEKEIEKLNQKLKEQDDKFKRDRSREREELKELQNQVKELLKEKKEIQISQETAIHEKDAILQQFTDLQEENKKLHGDLSQIGVLNANIKGLELKVANLESKIEELEGVSSNKDAIIEQLRDTENHLRLEITNKNDEILARDTQINELKSETLGYGQNLSDAELNINNLKSQISDLTIQLSNQKARNTELTAKIEQLNSTIKELNQQIFQKDGALQNLNEQFDDLNLKKLDLEQELSNSSKAIEQAEAGLISTHLTNLVKGDTQAIDRIAEITKKIKHSAVISLPDFEMLPKILNLDDLRMSTRLRVLTKVNFTNPTHKAIFQQFNKPNIAIRHDDNVKVWGIIRDQEEMLLAPRDSTGTPVGIIVNDPYQIEILGNILLTIWGQSRRDVEDENFSP